MGWYKPRTVIRQMPEPFSQFSVTFTSLDSVLYGKFMDIQKAFAKTEEDPMAIQQVMAMLVQDWNVTDPYTDEALPAPAKDGGQSIARLPIEFVVALTNLVAESAQGINPPKIDSSVQPSTEQPQLVPVG